MQYFGMPDLTKTTRKRRNFLDPTEGENPDLTVPNSLPSVFGGALPQAGTGVVPQGGGKRDMLANIFNAIASGAAIFGSQNPGETLMQQLTQRRQEAMQKQQMEAERQAQESHMNFQKAMKREEIAARKEEQKAEVAGRKELQQEEFKQNISLTDKRFLNDRVLQEDHAKANEALATLNNTFLLTRDAQNKQFQIELQKAKDAGDLTQIYARTTLGALLSANKYHSPVPIDVAMRIVNKIANNEVLTKEDTAIANNAMKAHAVAASQGIGGGTAIQKQSAKSDLEYQKEEGDLVRQAILADRVLEKHMDGSVTITRSNPDELAERVRSYISIYRDVSGRNKTNTLVDPNTGKEITNATPQVSESEIQVMNNVNNFLDQGGDPKAIDLTKLSPQLRKQVEARIKAKNSGSKFKIKGF